VIDRTTTVAGAVEQYLRGGQTVMVSGFGRGGTPFTILEHLADNEERFRDLTLVKNDANEEDLGIGMLIRRGMAKRLIATHIGLNPESIRLMNEKKLEVELVPQGIFAERIRAGGAGIPAFLTDIGVGTLVAEGKQTMTLDGRELILERALRGDVGLICADRVDPMGNCWWRGSNRNMAVVMATACERVIVEAREIVEVGAIAPEEIHLPGVFVDAVVPAAERRHIIAGRHF